MLTILALHESGYSICSNFLIVLHNNYGDYHLLEYCTLSTSEVCLSQVSIINYVNIKELPGLSEVHIRGHYKDLNCMINMAGTRYMKSISRLVQNPAADIETSY